MPTGHEQPHPCRGGVKPTMSHPDDTTGELDLSFRFENRGSSGGRDPLHFDLSIVALAKARKCTSVMVAKCHKIRLLKATSNFN